MPDYTRILSNSLGRMEKGESGKGDIISRFYDHFVQSSPEVSEKFSNTEMDRQKEMLRDSFNHMLTFSTTRRSGVELEGIAESHSHDRLDVAPRLYDLWLESLITTIRELDPECDKSVEMAWRIVMSPGIEFMKGHY